MIRGIDRSMSISRAMPVSIQPRKYPAMAPTMVPNVIEIATEMKPIDNEIRAPYRIRLKMSRPNLSVPSRCSMEGG